MKCINCINCDIEKYPGPAGVGFSRCKKETQSGVFESLTKDRECNKYQREPQAEIMKRIAWWENKTAVGG
jgi:hypothetical protein